MYPRKVVINPFHLEEKEKNTYLLRLAKEALI
jgi:hypothetical protein